MSAQDILKVADALGATALPMTALYEFVVPASTVLGFSTGKSRSGTLDLPIGEALVRALCACARHGRLVTTVHQAEDGCAFAAKLPSDLWANADELRISFARDGAGTRIDAATHIPGQLYDCGKSRRVVDAFFAELLEAPG